MIEVLEPGIGTTVQDHGRPGWAWLGVSPSGALDRASHDRANALVGNEPGAATLEITGGGVRLRAVDSHVVALAGAAAPGVAMDAPLELAPGDVLDIGRAVDGLRTYVAVAGGIDVTPVLGSRSHDQLSGLGPPPLVRGQRLAVGEPSPTGATSVGGRPPSTAPAVVHVWPGPRADRVVDAMAHLLGHAWRVGDDVNRVGVRLQGAPLRRVGEGELPSEGLVTGAIQVPHDGQPIVMLADHPTTGGYPVVAVVDPGDLDRLAHLRPGDLLRFRAAPGAPVDQGIG